PNADEFIEGLEKVDCSIAFSMKEDETAEKCKYIATTPHFLESWGDVQFTDTDYSLIQPTIQTLFNTRQFQETLLAGTENDTKLYDFLKENWEENILAGNSWNTALHDGLFETSTTSSEEENEEEDEENTINVDSAAQTLLNAEKPKGFELTLYTSTAIGDGQQANNPWLQELPDPITRSTWDNFISMSKADADELGVKNRNVSNGALNGSYVNLKLGDVSIENVPVMIQPG